jgi:tetratricopeptide (TPR) repeat protein
MNKALLVVVTAVWCVTTAGAQQPPANDLTRREDLAVDSLLHSAQNLYHTPTATARAGRLVAIANKVAELAPADLRAMRLLSDVWQSQDKLDEAAQAAERQLQANVENHAAGVRWIRLEMARLDRAEQRAELLKGIVGTPTLPAALRSVAATELATILIGQGAQADAKEVLDQAIELDPLNDSALVNRQDLMDNPTPVDRARTVVALLQGNPRAWWVSRELAGVLGDVGLHRQALGYLMHAWRLAEGNKPIAPNAPVSFAAEYVSALLDAGMAEEAVKLFDGQMDRLRDADTGQFQSLMVEAYRAAGQPDKAKTIAARSAKLYKGQLRRRAIAAEIQGSDDGAEMSVALATSLAWFSLLTADKPEEAVRYALQAGQMGASGDAQNLLLMAARVASGDAAAVERLEQMTEAYPLAAAILAEHYFTVGNEDAARKALQAGFAHPRRHLAYRKLARLANEHGYEIPPAEHADGVEAALKAADATVLQMGVEPERFIEVILRPVDAEIDLCAPVEVEAVLTNTSGTAVPLGQWGLLDTMLALKVRVDDTDRLTFTSLPVAIWPAPRMLKPGQSLTTTIRLDVGPLASYLANHPLKQVKLEVMGTISPRETHEGIVSGLPSLKAPVAQITRQGLLGECDGIGAVNADTYNRAIAGIEALLARGEPAERMRAARVIAAMLGWMRQTEAGADRIPPELRRVVSKPQLLGMMGRAQQSPLDVVRAELATALNYADLGSAILNQLGAMIEDPVPLVRFRVAELIGASGTNGSMQMVKMYASDPDAMVRMMAQAFLLDAAQLDPGAPAAPAPASPASEPAETPTNGESNVLPTPGASNPAVGSEPIAP